MNKDAVLATIIGFCIGLVITSVVLFGPTISKSLPVIHWPYFTFSLPSLAKPTPSPASNTKTETAPVIDLSVNSPIANEITQTSDLLVSGLAPTDSLVVITGPSDENVVSPNAEGKYAGKISLVEGKNDISVTMLSQKSPQSQAVTVFYTPETF